MANDDDDWLLEQGQRLLIAINDGRKAPGTVCYSHPSYAFFSVPHQSMGGRLHKRKHEKRWMARVHGSSKNNNCCFIASFGIVRFPKDDEFEFQKVAEFRDAEWACAHLASCWHKDCDWECPMVKHQNGAYLWLEPAPFKWEVYSDNYHTRDGWLPIVGLKEPFRSAAITTRETVLQLT